MSERGFQPQEDEVQIAFEELRGMLQSVEQSLGWRHEFLADVSAMRGLVKEYNAAMLKDRKAVERGDRLHKDFPKVKRYLIQPDEELVKLVRPRGFVDGAHSAEYQVSLKFSALLDRVEDTPLTQEDRHQLRAGLHVLALALHHNGMCLDQRKEMGAAGTMPQDPDQKPSNRKFAHTVFRRLHLMREEDKNR